jgi:hypothetical protein
MRLTMLKTALDLEKHHQRRIREMDSTEYEPTDIITSEDRKEGPSG